MRITYYPKTGAVKRFPKKHPKPRFEKCGCCGEYHLPTFCGDCRDDANRFHGGELDEHHGADGWTEIPLPTEEELDEAEKEDERRQHI